MLALFAVDAAVRAERVVGTVGVDVVEDRLDWGGDAAPVAEDGWGNESGDGGPCVVRDGSESCVIPRTRSRVHGVEPPTTYLWVRRPDSAGHVMEKGEGAECVHVE